MADTSRELRGRPVTADEARTAVTRLINSHFRNANSARCSIPLNAMDDDVVAADYVEEASERIKELEAKLAAKWISVSSESMPEYDTLVRLWNPLWPCASVGYWRHSHEWIGYFAPETHGPLPETNPTHWQPLPDPPVQP